MNTKEEVKQMKKLKKYKEMWEELESFEAYDAVEIPNEYLSVQGGAMKFIMKLIKQKYFPKPKKINYKDRFNELEEEFIQRERELEIEIEHWKYLYHNKQY